MKNKSEILTVIWLIYVFSDYFIIPYFVQPFLWLVVCLGLLFFSIVQLIKLLKKYKSVKTNRIVNLSVTTILFFLTFYNFNKIPRFFIEKMDWTIFYNKRIKMIDDVINGTLKSNTKINNGICELPFEFPIISNGGNDIWIYRNKDNNTRTIKFWISRGFFESPQTYFIFTNDEETKIHYQKLINSKPEFNWKLEKNWYRIMERD